MVSRHCQIAVNHSLMWNMISSDSNIKIIIRHSSLRIFCIFGEIKNSWLWVTLFIT